MGYARGRDIKLLPARASVNFSLTFSTFCASLATYMHTRMHLIWIFEIRTW